ncbi:MAG: transporter substrate-binding domain-containing protein [Acetanaerobacterium sp.]
MKMRKTVSVLIAAMLLMAVFAGCTPTPAAPSSEPAQTNEAPPADLPAELQAIVDAGVLKVGTKIDVPNFGYTNPDTNQTEGMEIEIVKMIAKDLLGDENAYEIQGVTAATRGPLIDNGEADLVIATFTITEERKLSYNFTRPYYTDAIGFLVKKDLGVTDIAGLDGKTVGVAQSATTKDALEELATEKGISFEYSEFASYPELKTALISGRIDAFSVDKSILLGYVDDSSMILEEGFKPQDYGIASKLDKKDLAEYLDGFIAKIEADGTLAQAISKWNLG